MTFSGTITTDHAKHPDQPQDQTAPLWPALLVCFLVATLINLGRIHQRTNSDELVPILGSLYAWEPFFWDQLRLGQLIPLLVMPIKHPLANLLVQSEISYFTCLLPFFLVPRYLQRGPYWIVTGAAVTLLYLLAASQEYLWMYWFPAQAYGPALTLALWGLIVLEDFPGIRQAPGRFAAAAFLILLAHWEIGTTAVLIAPFLLLRYLCRQMPFRECLVGLSLNCIAFAILFAVSLLMRELEIQLENPLFPFSFSPPKDWPAKWRAIYHSYHEHGGYVLPAFLIVTVAAPLLASLTSSGRTALRGMFARMTPAVLASTFFILFVTSMAWVMRTDSWICRYCMTPAALLIPAVAAACWAPCWPILLQRRSQLSIVCGLVILLSSATIAVSGRPSLSQVRRDIDQSCGQYTAELRAARVTHLDGDFWRVWPAMFHANLVAYERGETQLTWGTGYRSTAMQRRWRDVPASQVRLAILDDSGANWPLFSAFNVGEMPRKQHAKFETAIPPDLFLVWARGFYQNEGTPARTTRWARRHAQLWVCNRTSTTQPVRLEMKLRRDPGSPAQLQLDSEWFREEISLSSDPVPFDRTFDLTPGWHIVHLHCNGSRVAGETDTARWLCFRVADAHISSAVTTSPSSSEHSPLEVLTQAETSSSKR